LRIQFQIVMFAIFFNIAIFFIAATGFFPAGTTIYGDATTYNVGDVEYDINDPGKIPPPNEMLERLYTNTFTLEIATIPIVNIDLTYGALMIGIVVIGVIIGKATNSMVPIGLMLVGVMFTVMWSNSITVIDKATKGLDSSVNYFVLMFLVGMMFMFVILLYDTASGQKSTK